MKKGIALSLLIMMLLGVVGCGGGHAGTLPSRKNAGGTITLTFISSWGGNDPKANTIQQIIDKFCAENPQIKVLNQSVFGDDFLPYLTRAFTSGNDPDVFGLWPGSNINNMIAAGKVADLSNTINNDQTLKSSFNDDMWQYVTYNNRIYGLPMEIVFEGLFVNRDLFTKYNVTIPTTFQGLVNAVQIFNKNGVTAIAYNITSEGTYLYQNIAASIGGKAAIENPIASGSINPCYIKAMEDMKILYTEHAFPTDYLTINSNERNSLFTSKKAAMIVQGSWFSAEIPEGSNVDVVRFPDCSENGSGASRMVYGLGNGILHMSQKAWSDNSKRDAAVKLLKYIASKQSAAMLASQTGMLSNVKLGGNIAHDSLTTKGLTLISESSELIGPPDNYVPRHAWDDIIVKEFPYMFEGTKKADEIWSDALKDGVD